MSIHNLRRPVLALVAAVGMAAAISAADILSQLGVTPAAAKEALMSEVGSGWINYGLVAPAFRSAPAALRVQLVEGTIGWAKAYTASPEFAAAYAKMRDNRKPQPPRFEGTPEEEQARQRAQQEKDQARGAEEMKQALASMAPEQRKQMEEAMAQAAAMMKQMDTPEMRKMMLDGIRMQREEQTRSYTTALAKWQDEYPENPAPVMARRIKTFLDRTADVDFEAKLEQKYGKMRFVNEAYETKPSEWKLVYRAGKEPATAARAALQAWMKELGR